MDDLFAALSEKKRLRIINLLRDNDLCVCEIKTLLQIHQSTASRHLNRLKKIGILESNKKAQWVHYELSSDFINKNRLLYNYLIKKMDTIDIYIKDTTILNKYLKSDLSCENIEKVDDSFFNIF